MTYFNPDVKAQIAFLANFLDLENSQSLVVIQKHSANEILKGRLRTSHIEGRIYQIKDLSDEIIRNEVFEALFKGLVGFLHANNKLSFAKGADLLSQKNVVITARHPETDIIEEAPATADKDSTEEESFTSFETIPDEVYQKFLMQFEKITQPETSEIDEAMLYKMLENNEISEAAMKKIIDCANVDEKFLDELLKAQPPLIDNRVYDKLMDIISPEK